MNYEVVSIEVNAQYNLTVTDINGDDVTQYNNCMLTSSPHA